MPGKSITIRGKQQGIVSTSVTFTESRTFEYTGKLDAIELSGEGWLTLCKFDPRSPDDGWGISILFCLPVTNKDYACHCPYTDGTKTGDLLEAQSRLSRVPDGVRNPYLEAFRDQLYDELIALATGTPGPQWHTSSGEPALENPDHLAYILLASLDPYVARILGLYCIDHEICNTQKAYDYKIEGRWLKKVLVLGGTHHLQDNSISYSDYVYQLDPTTPRHMPVPPQGLKAWELKGWSLAPKPEADNQNLNAIGLEWRLNTLADEENKDGKLPPYRGYDLGIEFNENYVDRLYFQAKRPLTVRIQDNNGKTVAEMANYWGSVLDAEPQGI